MALLSIALLNLTTQAKYALSHDVVLSKGVKSKPDTCPFSDMSKGRDYWVSLPIHFLSGNKHNNT